MRLRTFFPLLTALALQAGAPAALASQRLGASAGPVVPLGGFGEHRRVGLRAQLSLASPGGLFRADVAGMVFPGSEDSGGTAWRTGTWRSTSLAASVLPRLRRSEMLGVRAVAGLSAHRMSIRGAPSPYGTVPGAQLGALLERRWSAGTLTAETGVHLVASDYGVDEMHGSFSLPLLLGFRF